MPRTILLADDSVTIQKVVELTFMDEDYEVETVGDGSAALAQLESRRPDLLITDVHMPGADGYEVCSKAKAAYPDLPVLLLVGTFEPFDEGQAAASGADAHLKKPFDAQDLQNQVEALIAGGSEPAEARPAEAPPAETPPAETPPAEAPPEEAPSVAPDGDPITEEIELELEPIETGTEESVSADTQAAETVVAEEPPVEPPPPADSPFATSLHMTAFPPEVIEDEQESEAPTTVVDTGSLGAPRASSPTEIVTEDSQPTQELAVDGAGPATDTAAATSSNGARLDDADVDRIARRVAELLGDGVLREIAWEVVPDLAEVVIKERLRELESEVE